MIDQTNLAENMLEEDLLKIGRRVVDFYEQDEDSRSEWMGKRARWVAVYNQNLPPENAPYSGSSTESVPILPEAVHQFHSRAKAAMFPGRKVFSALPVGRIDDLTMERADRVAKHINWQVMVRDKRYERDKDALISSTALHGSCYTKAFPSFDPRYRPVVRNVRAVDLVVPYGVGPRMIDDVERITEIIHTTVGRTERWASEGYLLEPAQAYTGGQSETQEATDDAEGMQESRDSDLAQLLEAHCWIALGDDPEPKPWVITVDREAGKVLRIQARYTYDQGFVKPINYYTAYDYLPNPDGFYGLGLGHLVGNLNISATKLIRMITDASEMSTTGNMSGFVDQGAGIPGDSIELILGVFRKISAGGDISRSFWQPNFPGPNATMGEVLQLIMGRADRLATVTEALTGQTDAVMKPTTILALIDQAMATIAPSIGRLLYAMGEEAQKIYTLNRLYLEGPEYFTLMDQTSEPVSIQVSVQDYADDFQILPIADPSQATEQQKMARAEAEWAFILSNPVLAQDPKVLTNAARRFYEAMKTRNPQDLLPDMMEPQRGDNPEKENMAALAPVPNVPRAYPDQDHVKHLQSHMGFVQAYEGDLSNNGGAEAMGAHIQEHVMMMYGQRHGLLEQSPMGVAAE